VTSPSSRPRNSAWPPSPRPEGRCRGSAASRRWWRPGRNLLRAPQRLPGLRASVSTSLPPAARGRPGHAPRAPWWPRPAVVDPSAQGAAARLRRPGRPRRGPHHPLPGALRRGRGPRIGDDCILDPARGGCGSAAWSATAASCSPARCGGDGFGFAFDMEGDGSGPRHYNVPQAGHRRAGGRRRARAPTPASTAPRSAGPSSASGAKIDQPRPCWPTTSTSARSPWPPRRSASPAPRTHRHGRRPWPGRSALVGHIDHRRRRPAAAPRPASPNDVPAGRDLQRLPRRAPPALAARAGRHPQPCPSLAKRVRGAGEGPQEAPGGPHERQARHRAGRDGHRGHPPPPRPVPAGWTR